MILTIGGIKGGSGKTTVATNLACIAAGQHLDVLLVDADDQETASDFTVVRKEDYPAAPRYTCAKLSGKSVRTEILELARSTTIPSWILAAVTRQASALLWLSLSFCLFLLFPAVSISGP